MIVLYIIGGLYLSCALLFYFCQHWFFFRPELLPSGFQYKYQFPFSEHSFEFEDGGSVNAILFEVPNSRGVVYYLKGNSRSIKGWGKFAKDFLGKGYDFFMIDYRGFGKSRGRRSENILYSDTNQVYDWLMKKYAESRILLYGRSFGSGIAAECASRHSPVMLILDSPYYTFRYQVGRFLGWLPLSLLLNYRIPTIDYLTRVRCPVHIIHGDRDYIISYEQGKRLAEECKSHLITIKGGRHNNLPSLRQYHEELNRVLSTVVNH